MTVTSDRRDPREGLFGIDLGVRHEGELDLEAEPDVTLVPTPTKRPVRTLTERLADAAAVRNGTALSTSVVDPHDQDPFEGH